MIANDEERLGNATANGLLHHNSPTVEDLDLRLEPSRERLLGCRHALWLLFSVCCTIHGTGCIAPARETQDLTFVNSDGVGMCRFAAAPDGGLEITVGLPDRPQSVRILPGDVGSPRIVLEHGASSMVMELGGDSATNPLGINFRSKQGVLRGSLVSDLQGEVALFIFDREGKERAVVGWGEDGGEAMFVTIDSKGKPVWVSPSR